MTTPLTFLANRSLDRRNLIKGAAALAATAATATAASAATVAPSGQLGAPTQSTDPLPLGPLSGSRYPDSHLESAHPKASFGPSARLGSGYRSGTLKPWRRLPRDMPTGLIMSANRGAPEVVGRWPNRRD